LALDWFWKGCKPNSVCTLAGGENHLSERPIPETCLAFTRRGAGSPSVSNLALHPMGFAMPCRLRFTRCALTAPFHHHPACARLSVFCGTVRRGVLKRRSCVYPNRTGLGYAASRPVEFGLSSPGNPGAIPRPSKTKGRLANSLDSTSREWEKHASLPRGWCCEKAVGNRGSGANRKAIGFPACIRKP